MDSVYLFVNAKRETPNFKITNDVNFLGAFKSSPTTYRRGLPAKDAATSFLIRMSLLGVPMSL